MSGIVGAGLTMGKFYSLMGRKIENMLGYSVYKVGYGPLAVYEKMMALRNQVPLDVASIGRLITQLLEYSRAEQPAVRYTAIEKITAFVEEDISDISSSFLLREGALTEGTMMSRGLQQVVQDMYATPLASLSTHEKTICFRVEHASTYLEVHIAGMVLLSPGCFKNNHANCNPPYEICTSKSSASADVSDEQKKLWRSAFRLLLTMLHRSQYVQETLRYFFCLFTQFPNALYSQSLYVRLCTELKDVASRPSSYEPAPSSLFLFQVDAIATVCTILQERCIDSLFWSLFSHDSLERVIRTKDLSVIKQMHNTDTFCSDINIWNRLGCHKPPFLQSISRKRFETVLLFNKFKAYVEENQLLDQFKWIWHENKQGIPVQRKSHRIQLVRTYYEGGIYPGWGDVIRNSLGSVHFVANGQHKVACDTYEIASELNLNVKWVYCHAELFPGRVNLVVGGYEPFGSTYKLLYIARVPPKSNRTGCCNISNQTQFHFGVVSEGSLAFFSNGHDTYVCDEYEVLVYDDCPSTSGGVDSSRDETQFGSQASVDASST